MEALTMEHAKKTCKIGKGEKTCRYITTGPAGIECAKLTPLKKVIDARVENGTFNAKGDNCEGFDHTKEQKPKKDAS